MDARDDEILTPEEMDTIWTAATAQLRQLLHRRKAKLRLSVSAPEPLPVDKPAPTPYVEPDKDFVLVRSSPFISKELAQELVDASRELREWLSSPNPSMDAATTLLIASTLEHRLNNAIRSMETAIRQAEEAVRDAEDDEE